MDTESQKLFERVKSDLAYLQQDIEERGGTARAAIHIGVDPVHGDAMGAEFTLYTDDGRGNGDHIVTVRLADLIDAARKYIERREAIENPPETWKPSPELLDCMLPPIERLQPDYRGPGVEEPE